MTKAIVADGDRTGPSLRWAAARRGRLAVYSDRLECGDWSIPYERIEDSVLVARSGIFVSGYVLRVRMAEQTYHFGLNANRFWTDELPFAPRRESLSSARVWTYRALRAAVFTGLAYLVWSS